MPHPLMFDPTDPVLSRVREIALALPEAIEKVAHGQPTFRSSKVFAYYGGSVRAGEPRAGHRHGQSVLIVPDPSERTALEQDPRTFVPAYLGPSGWLGIDLSGSVDWTEIAELIDASFRQTATARLIRLLDDQGPAIDKTR
ncbi:MmcQ/YjbR family DNA-binding protein [Williamsia sp. CHRR-6]|uniref:MmcQ/YjbR family DNA-binding protein n=1 Tax=Williamsia sp. CHRR-6 TaxID=2835871 RepID=UPI001BDB6BD8|nr:MmcQ/YjbR family DNA-binding protein [Williamsia sp. CHRR-6]MBT0565464.1 MmcQ/YjbR family DNA-binding protein [Williamsia sp. CHRR-6]